MTKTTQKRLTAVPNFHDLLSPTTGPDAEPAAGSQEKPAEQEKRSPPKGRSSAKEKEKPSADPYEHAARLKWPFVEGSDPYLIPFGEDFKTATAALSVRIPFDLERTIQKHCASLGMKNTSEWCRAALKNQLAAEQKAMGVLEEE